MKKVLKIVQTIIDIIKLPTLNIGFFNYCDETKNDFRRTYESYTKRHPKYKFFSFKTVGVALVNINNYNSFEEYYKSINGKNSSAYYSRKAIKRGYRFLQIDRNDYIDDIYEINVSSEFRQGRKMGANYLKKIDSFSTAKYIKCYGVVNEKNRLLSYCTMDFYGEFVSVNQLLGHKKYLNDGIMYLMMIEIHKTIFEQYGSKGYNYIMYDTYFGAMDGLKKFKDKLGYKPYKVKWLWRS